MKIYYRVMMMMYVYYWFKNIHVDQLNKIDPNMHSYDKDSKNMLEKLERN